MTIDFFLGLINKPSVDLSIGAINFISILIEKNASDSTTDTLRKIVSDINHLIYDDAYEYAFENLYDILLFISDDAEQTLLSPKNNMKFISEVISGIIRMCYLSDDSIPEIGELFELIAHVTDRIDEQKALIASQEEKIKDTLANSIGVLSIFVALITVMFGGFNLINAFQAMVEQTIYRLLLSIAFVGLVIFNMLFLLMFLISKILGKRIHANCNNFEFEDFEIEDRIRNNESPSILYEYSHCAYCIRDKDDENRCGAIEKIFKKYPYIGITNLFIILFMIGLGLTNLANRAIMSGFVLKPAWFVFLLVIIVGLLFTLTIYCFWAYGKRGYSERYKKKLEKQKANEDEMSKTILPEHFYLRRTCQFIVIALILIVICIYPLSLTLNIAGFNRARTIVWLLDQFR